MAMVIGQIISPERHVPLFAAQERQQLQPGGERPGLDDILYFAKTGSENNCF
ncbi:MAG: hypothetical protein OEY27_06955 [Gammaproteobacteria bacterium]|nr:hypothetical protein [Gammaproteobacteria bacterium]